MKKNNQHHEIKNIPWEEFKKASSLQLFPLRIVDKASFEVEKNPSDTQMQHSAFQVLACAMSGTMGENLSGWTGRWMPNGWMHMGGWINPHYPAAGQKRHTTREQLKEVKDSVQEDRKEAMQRERKGGGGTLGPSIGLNPDFTFSQMRKIWPQQPTWIVINWTWIIRI